MVIYRDNKYEEDSSDAGGHCDVTKDWRSLTMIDYDG